MHDEDNERHAAEVARLEEALSDRAELVRELRRQLQTQERLVRDMGARWEAMLHARAATASWPLSGVEAQRDAAVGRALEAEAAAIEARTALDELRGRLAVAPVQTGPDPATLAAQEGLIRGLRARLAEAEDARDRAEARLMLTEQDLEDARGRVAGVQRLLFEAQERIEMEAIRASVAEGHLARQRGESLGARYRAGESEAALSGHRDALAHVSDRLQRVEGQLVEVAAERDSLRTELTLARAESDATGSLVATLRTELEAACRDVGLLQRGLADSEERRQQLERTASAQSHADAGALSRLQEALAVTQADLAAVQGQLANTRDDLAEREADLAEVRASSDGEGLAIEVAQLREGLQGARDALMDLWQWLAGDQQALASTTSFELETPLGVSSRPPREDETAPGIPLHVQAAEAVEGLAVEALEAQLAAKDEQLRMLEARLAELLSTQGI